MTSHISGPSNVTWHNTLMLREELAPASGIVDLFCASFEADFEMLDQHLGKLLGDELNSVATRRQLTTQMFVLCHY